MKINIHTSHASAFISSTFRDLEKERNAVANVLKNLNPNINALDVRPASNNSSRKEILSGIKESDFIILIIGERYGSIIPEMTQSKKMSITRWEYLRATRNFNKHVLVYFKQVNSNDPIYYDNRDARDFKIKRRYLDEFKKILSNTHNLKYFSTPEGLAEEVKNAIIPIYRNGVMSLINKNETLLRKIDSLTKENNMLNSVKTERTNVVKPQPQLLGLGGLSRTVPPRLGLGIAEEGFTVSNNLPRLGLSKDTKK